MEAIRHHGAKALYRIEVASSDKPLDFLVERSAEFDLLVVGATKVKFLEKAAVGPLCCPDRHAIGLFGSRRQGRSDGQENHADLTPRNSGRQKIGIVERRSLACFFLAIDPRGIWCFTSRPDQPHRLIHRS